jgi:transposase
MPVYIGVDFHARTQTVCYLKTESGETQTLTLRHQADEVRAFYAQFSGEVIVGFETSGYALWFEALLESLGHQIWVGNPAEIRRLAPRRQKNDRRDAELILQLMLSDRFPRLYRRSKESRQVLQQLRYRQRLVKMRTMVLNILQYLALTQGQSLRSKLQSQRGQQRIKALSLAEPLATQRDELLELREHLSIKIATIEQWLQQHAEADARVVRLRTHHGIGVLTGLCLVHTLWPVERFANSRKVTAFAGFDPTENSSAERVRYGPISKAGSRHLRFLLVEAAQIAIRRDAQLKSFYCRIQRRHNHQKAKVAVARRLLVRAFIMLRDEIDYPEFIQRGVAARSSRRCHKPNVLDP